MKTFRKLVVIAMITLRRQPEFTKESRASVS